MLEHREVRLSRWRLPQGAGVQAESDEASFCALLDLEAEAMLSTLCELDAAVTAVGTSTSFAASSRLHFWLGMLSEEKLLEEILGDSVVLGTLQRIARSGHTFPRLAARALTLTILALRIGPKGPEAKGPEGPKGSPKCVEFWETMLEAGLQGFAAAAAADDEIFEALRGLLEMAPQAREGKSRCVCRVSACFCERLARLVLWICSAAR